MNTKKHAFKIRQLFVNIFIWNESHAYGQYYQPLWCWNQNIIGYLSQ